MDYKVVFSPLSLRSLKALVNLIAENNPSAAHRVGLRLLHCSELIGRFPEMGSIYRGNQAVRHFWCKPYSIYYRVDYENRVIEIMEFWHPARDHPNL
jgi:toxin ParE1/3/4